MNTVPGASDLGWGFDIFGDYGESSLKAQLFQFSSGTTWTDPISGVNYQLPANVSLSMVEKSSTNAQVFDSAESVQQYFAAKASLEASYVSEFGAFSGAFNSAYEKNVDQTHLYKYALIDSENIAWRLTLESQSLAQLTPEVQAEITALPDSFSAGSRVQFFRFIRRYGTHYVSRVAVGGRLYYYVAIEKSYLSDDTKINAGVTLEYDAVLVSAKAKSEVEWSQLGKSWVESRTANVEVVGGTPDALLLGIPEYDDNRSTLFTTWVESIKIAPAAMDFQLRPVSALMPAAKSAAMEAAVRAYMSDNLLVVEARSISLPFPEPPKPDQLPVITLGESIRPDSPPPHNFGFQMVIIKPENDDYEIYLNKYYSIDLYIAQEGYSTIFDAMMADIRGGNYTEGGYLLVLASYDWSWQAPPTSDFYNFLRSSGGGALLKSWMDGVGNKGSINSQNSLYILVGATAGGPNLGVEALAKATMNGGPLSSVVTVRLDGLNIQAVSVSDSARRVLLQAAD